MTDRAQPPEYRISPAAPIEAELVRIGCAEIDFAHCLVSGPATDPGNSIHQCRKAIKRLRALIRLGREANRRAAGIIDRRLRNASRLLAASRDADVIEATAIRLGRKDDGKAAVDGQRLLVHAKLDASVMEAVAAHLKDVRKDVVAFIANGSWSIDSVCAAIEREFHTMRRARRRFAASGRKPDAHEWRKTVQRCANQIRLIEILMPQFAAVRGAHLDSLAEVLGDFNDLTILQRALKSKRPGLRKKAAKKLRRRAKAQQRKLRKLALRAGDAIGV